MTSTAQSTAAVLRSARVGELLPRRIVDRDRPRRLDATAILQPGSGRIDTYRSGLLARAADFAGWDGRLQVADADDRPDHRLLVVDRYRQVYATHDALDPRDLPDADALLEWFRFLATACPECGVLDEAVLAGPTP